MERLTKTYSDGTHGAADNLQCGENSYAYKGLLLEALGKYEDLEEQGRLLRLPCKVGDSVYRFGYADGKAYKVQKLVIRTLANLVAIMESGEFGKSVFLSLEEAENKLKKWRKNHEF